jgi:hypothetical protein
MTEYGRQIHLVRSHFKQVAIGAANSGLDSFHLQWEAQRCNGDDRCGSPAHIYYNRGWQTRFSRGYHAPAPDIFVALYSDCRSEWMCDGEEGTVWVADGERLFALVLEIEYDSFSCKKNRRCYYMWTHQSLSQAEYDGLNFIHSAWKHARGMRVNRVEVGEYGQQLWYGLAKTHVPGVARRVLHKVIDQMESQFGQGKGFFAENVRNKR